MAVAVRRMKGMMGLGFKERWDRAVANINAVREADFIMVVLCLLWPNLCFLLNNTQ